MIDFEELDYRPTPMGELVLRRRGEPRLDGREVYEVKLGDDFLMSSLFVDGEIALTDLGLAPLANTQSIDVVVGGLGLGYTAAQVLEYDNVASLFVVETMDAVIDWHQRGLVPLGRVLTADSRTQYIQGDFFKMAAAGGSGFDPDSPAREFDAVLLDVDHSPSHVLAPAHATLYTVDGLSALAERIKPGGVFALWSNDPPESEFESVMGEVFAKGESHVVEFDNPFTQGTSTNTVYVATRRGHSRD